MKAASFRPRIYMAGPDVFFPARDAIFERLVAYCERLGMIGLAPYAGRPDESVVGDDAIARHIYEENVALIQSADGVIANLMSFSGDEPDSGTVFEVGFAVALHKPVVAYGVPESTYASRVAASIDCATDSAGVLREAQSGVQVEGLGQRLNLMLTRSVSIAPSAEAALQLLAQRFGALSPP